MRERWRWLVRRTAWLMVGAAIGLAAVLLLTGLAQVAAGGSRWTALFLAPALLLGLLPGVRDLEVTAAQALLGATGDLVVPGRVRAAHRWRTVVLVTLHLVLGLVAAALLVALLPGLVAAGFALVEGRDETLVALRLAGLPRALVAGLLPVLAASALLAVVGLGRLAALLAPRLLGPTAHDRLEVALARLDAEAGHIRLARDLHDGIGHALTVISVQAAGGRRVLAHDPAEAGHALSRIEESARTALDELDNVLGLLRDDGPRHDEPDLSRLPALLDAHRSSGMTLVAELGAVGDVPALVSGTAYRVVAEALVNASRHAGPGPVRLRLDRTRDGLVVDTVNPLPAGTEAGSRIGRGLDGMRERVALFGGRLDAGPQEQSWVLHADIPTGTSGG